MMPLITKNGVYMLAATLGAVILCVVFSFVFTNVLRQIFIFSSVFLLLISTAVYFFNREIEKAAEENKKPEVQIN